ncbi:MAG: DUF4258 domain-containing protein [Sulfuricellaceae bacterium]
MEQRIRQIAKEDTSRLVFTRHTEMRMRERKISKTMALDCLRNGHIRRIPEPNTLYGTIECRMEHYAAGVTFGLVIAVSELEPNLIIVTAMNIED